MIEDHELNSLHRNQHHRFSHVGAIANCQLSDCQAKAGVPTLAAMQSVNQAIEEYLGKLSGPATAIVGEMEETGPQGGLSHRGDPGSGIRTANCANGEPQLWWGAS